MRRPVFMPVLAGLAAAAVFASAGEARGQSDTPHFKPKSLLISRKALAGVTPKMTFEQVKAAWGRSPNTGRGPRGGWGRAGASWGNYFFTSPTAAWVNYTGGLGAGPIMFTIDLAWSAQLGLRLRTPYGDRAGTSIRVFRRHWPNARRLKRSGWTYFVAQTAYRKWRLVFVFDLGRLKEASFMHADFFDACIAKPCRNGYPREGGSY